MINTAPATVPACSRPLLLRELLEEVSFASEVAFNTPVTLHDGRPVLGLRFTDSSEVVLIVGETPVWTPNPMLFRSEVQPEEA